MFKLVVLSALFVAALAEPAADPAADPQLFYSRGAYAAAVPVPLSASYVQQASGYYPAASVYSALPYAHLIKKRSPQFFSDYIARSAYIAGAPLVAPYASAYVAPAAPLAAAYPSAVLPAHLIKKRSAAIIAAPASYIAPAPIASSYIAPAPLAYSNPYLPYSAYYPAYSAGFPYFKK